MHDFWSGEVLSLSFALSLARLTNGRDRSVYKHNEIFPLSFQRSLHLSVRFRLYPPFGFADSRANGRKAKHHDERRTSNTHSISASDTLTAVSLLAPHRSQTHFRNFCPYDNAISQARHAELSSIKDCQHGLRVYQLKYP